LVEANKTIEFLVSFLLNAQPMDRAVTFLLLILFILVLQPEAAGQGQDFEAEMKMVDAHLASGNITKALVVLEDILVKEPTNIRVQEKKMNVLLASDRSKDAGKDIEEYVLMYPNRPEYLYLRALLNMKREKFGKAIDDFNRAVQLDMPDGLEHKVYLNRGMSYFNNGDFELAEADFDQVISLDSKNAAAYHGKGMVKYDAGNYDDAVAEFTKSLKIDDSNPIVHFNMAMSYFRLNESDNACYHFNKSCALGHRNACRLLMMECDINIAP
jgi:tetratricopeptide (TPR) repeat protein